VCRGGVAGADDAGGVLTLAFRGGPPDALITCVADALQHKAWLVEPPPPMSTRISSHQGQPTNPGGGGGGNVVTTASAASAATASHAVGPLGLWFRV
jgi:hypothetical protein